MTSQKRKVQNEAEILERSRRDYARNYFNKLKQRFAKEKNDDGSIIINPRNIPLQNIYFAVNKTFTAKNKETGEEEQVYFYHYLKDGEVYDEEPINALLSYNFNIFERLRENQPRRLFFDIDIDSTRGHKNHNKYQIEDIVCACSQVVQFVAKKLNIEYDDDKTQICYVVDQTIKQSLHLTYDIYFRNSYDCSQFFQYIRHILLHSSCTDLTRSREVLTEGDGENQICLMDSKVYSKSQNMRCLYQSKAGKETAILVPYGKSSTEPTKHLIGLYDTEQTYPFVDMRAIVESMETRNIQRLQRSTPKRKLGGELRAYSKDEITYDMTIQDPILRYMSCIPNSNTRPQSWTLWNTIGSCCWSLQNTTGKDYYTAWLEWSKKASSHYPNEDEECKARFEYYDTYYKANDKAEYLLRSIATKYVGVNVLRSADTTRFYEDLYELDLTNWETQTYSDRYCIPLDFTKYDIICEKAGLGLGKTTIIQRYVTSEKPKRIIIVGCRKSFCREKYADFLKLCPDLVYYGDDTFRSCTDPSKLDKVVIEYESLHKLGIIDNLNAYDLVILDEIEGLLDTVTSDTNAQNLSTNITTFEDLIKTGKKCIMADAFVSNKTLALLEDIKQDTGKSILIRINQFKRSGKTARIMCVKKHPKDKSNPKQQMERHILDYIKQGKKVAVITASRQYGEELTQSLSSALKETGQDPQEVLRYYERFCDDLQLQHDLNNVRKEWGKLSVLVYTTKITVGVNYDDSTTDETGTVVRDLLNFDTIFVYGSCACPNIKNMIQAHFRVRHIKEDSIYVYIYDVPNTFAEKATGSENKRQPKRYADFKALTDEYNKRFTSQSNTYDKIITYNEYEQDINYNDYTRIFKYYLMECGYTIEEDRKSKEDETPETTHSTKGSTVEEPPTQEGDCEIVVRLDDVYTVCNTSALRDNLRYKIEGERATRYDKILNEAVFMYSKYLKYSPTFATDMLNVDEEERDKAFAKMLKDYTNKPHIREQMENIKIEKVRRANDAGEGLQPKDKTKKNRGEQNRLMMWDIVEEMCRILNMESSLSIQEVDEEKMIQYIDTLQGKNKEQQEIIRKLFKLRVSVKKDKENAKTLEAKGFISGILSGWNGHTLGSNEKKHGKKDATTGKMKYFRSYTYHTQQEATCDLLKYCKDIECRKPAKEAECLIMDCEEYDELDKIAK